MGFQGFQKMMAEPPFFEKRSRSEAIGLLGLPKSVGFSRNFLGRMMFEK